MKEQLAHSGQDFNSKDPTSRCGLVVRRQADKQKDLGSIRFGSPFSSKIVAYGHCLVILPTNIKMAHTAAHL